MRICISMTYADRLVVRCVFCTCIYILLLLISLCSTPWDVLLRLHTLRNYISIIIIIIDSLPSFKIIYINHYTDFKKQYIIFEYMVKGHLHRYTLFHYIGKFHIKCNHSDGLECDEFPWTFLETITEINVRQKFELFGLTQLGVMHYKSFDLCSRHTNP